MKDKTDNVFKNTISLGSVRAWRRYPIKIAKHLKRVESFLQNKTSRQRVSSRKPRQKLESTTPVGTKWSDCENATPDHAKMRAFSMMEDDGSSQRVVYGGDLLCSQHKKGPIPCPESKIRMVPVKDSAKQYHSHLFQGGWRVSNVKDSANEIRKIKARGQGNKPERDESRQAEEARLEPGESMLTPQNPTNPSFATTTTITVAVPPAKERKTDYLRLISCIPSDKIWKSWENKHLLCSHANGSSFA